MNSKPLAFAFARNSMETLLQLQTLFPQNQNHFQIPCHHSPTPSTPATRNSSLSLQSNPEMWENIIITCPKSTFLRYWSLSLEKALTDFHFCTLFIFVP
ncbi:hypothetical protein VIGAN_08164700 [Vigna angularis var. angularis]|uniref:Uncharacterized protein n=1 Tax=Vigna angularis var. angularis TaxID=157739 RepID=A0A0S3SQ86_PHAAN|nr:hypothetical protein VIGAN_08164700 [Vigna angularis var. angularis]